MILVTKPNHSHTHTHTHLTHHHQEKKSHRYNPSTTTTQSLSSTTQTPPIPKLIHPKKWPKWPTAKTHHQKPIRNPSPPMTAPISPLQQPLLHKNHVATTTPIWWGCLHANLRERERKEVPMGFGFEVADIACRKWFFEDDEEETYGVAMAWQWVWDFEKEEEHESIWDTVRVLLWERAMTRVDFVREEFLKRESCVDVF